MALEDAWPNSIPLSSVHCGSTKAEPVGDGRVLITVVLTTGHVKRVYSQPPLPIRPLSGDIRQAVGYIDLDPMRSPR